jgi:ubiquinone/menaquinone biosynthesis C-methylase UbiE
MCSGVLRVLKPGGVFLQISFAQPHFRIPHLSGKHADASYSWSCTSQEIEGYSMPHFCYMMVKQCNDTPVDTTTATTAATTAAATAEVAEEHADTIAIDSDAAAHTAAPS